MVKEVAKLVHELSMEQLKVTGVMGLGGTILVCRSAMLVS